MVRMSIFQDEYIDLTILSIYALLGTNGGSVENAGANFRPLHPWRLAVSCVCGIFYSGRTKSDFDKGSYVTLSVVILMFAIGVLCSIAAGYITPPKSL